MIKDLATQIKGYYPNLILAPVRGGWIPARILSDLLDVSYLESVTISSDRLRARSFADPSDKSILIVDDIADSGKTLLATMRFCRFNKARHVKCATLFYKESSLVKPDWYAAKTENWVVFPWEETSRLKEIKEDFKR
jgi:hypothetical protein